MQLGDLQFYTGSIDGVQGSATTAAIKKFQMALRTKATGVLTSAQEDELNRRFAMRVFATIAADIPDDVLQRPEVLGKLKVSYAPGEISASRLFAGPDDYPPIDFAAYGIVAFKAHATSRDRDRHIMICEAYVASIRSAAQLGRLKSEQMVTVWPIRSAPVAVDLTISDSDRNCNRAVDQYGNINADRALREARAAGADVNGIGPYLLAWSPPAKKGEPDAVVLIADLSDVRNYEQALQIMSDWVRDIERDPHLWSRGWTLDAIRLKMQRWVDRRGTQLLTAVAGAN